MVTTGLESFLNNIPSELKGKRAGVLCHSSSITSDFSHVIDVFHDLKEFKLSAVFGPQHGLHGQTQDNMIEWQSERHPEYDIPLFSLYGEHRKPTRGMLNELDALIVDLQDTGTRIYTYIWTVKLCMEACAEAGIPIWVLDRPNPVGRLPCDGPVLKEAFFTFVGGACIPLCHRMTMGEMALWIKDKYHPSCDLKIIRMENWKRSLLYSETGLPWVLPSPNMPTLQTAIVYPGTVLIEALNLSEGRGTTLPFELFGAPFINSEKLRRNLINRKINGCAFRIHNYIPTFHKFCGQLCNGMQIHVTDISIFKPVETAVEIFDAIIETSAPESLSFIPPPYEYERKLMPFDILSGDSGIREVLIRRGDLRLEKQRWAHEIEIFKTEFKEYSLYKE
ncbi:MAG: hypothetical protein A2X05_10495 [Bacteroidetes bacterium GWE2_41_25]|nr:MAG: hypothetical protein A2X03_13300 [Bacteroidetes bacterium GWA2_40_15]OFX93294.1 MAG: hypothetical protein A2X06_01955 [Bacteroidetes bacterium GWC2_40_22]OFY13447.1 MAG: hypothetical protein A2X05_10495 [Bacteroidetes bacterium GWE2_41_25]HAM08686.1 DUF1343 domain-containing protein [Bacteroidales bacterium]HBH83236.1 DUF1343 domain-containing protein [Bacteroidales bacterium]